MSQTRVEGTISLKLNGFINADIAATYLSAALTALEEVWAQEADDEDLDFERSIEVVQVNLYQVSEVEDEQDAA